MFGGKHPGKNRCIVQSQSARSAGLLCIGIALFALPSFADQRPRVALVLSGGGARGGAHIGVLRVLEREGVPIDLIVGVSYGALVGGLYAAGYSVDNLERIIADTDWGEITNNSPDRRLSNLNRKPVADRQMVALRLDNLELKLPYGIFAGQKIQQFLNQLTLGATYRARSDFDRLPIPFRAIATDILSGDQVVLKSGSLGAAIRASISVPGIFAPMSTEQTHLVDGGIVNNLPVDVALDAGADLVIAVDCATPLRTRKHEVDDIVDVIDQAVSFRIEEKKIANRKLAHVLMTPDLKGFDGADFNLSHTLIAIGITEAENHLEAIRSALGTLGVSRRTGASGTSILPDGLDIRKWTDIPPDIVIDRVRIKGLKRYSHELFERRFENIKNKPVSFRKLESESARLYATGLFQTVNYQILDREGRTELVFYVLENPPSEVRAGLRYDNDFRVSALGEFVHQSTYGRVSELYLRGMAGNLSFAELNLFFRSSGSLRLLGELRGWHQERLYFQDRQRRGAYKERRLRARVGMQVLFGSWGGLKAGYQVEQVRIRNVDRSIDNASEYMPGLWFSGSIDTRDNSHLPKRGIYFRTRIKWVRPAYSQKQLQTEFAIFSSPYSRLSVGVRSSGGYVTRSAPMHEYLALGGAGHFSDAALPVVGLNRDELKVSRFVSLGVSVWKHVKTWETLPRSAIGVFYQGGIYNMVTNPNRPNVWIHGFGIGGYVNTSFLGPMRVDVVSTEKRKIRIYTGIGFGF